MASTRETVPEGDERQTKFAKWGVNALLAGTMALGTGLAFNFAQGQPIDWNTILIAAVVVTLATGLYQATAHYVHSG